MTENNKMKYICNHEGQKQRIKRLNSLHGVYFFQNLSVNAVENQLRKDLIVWFLTKVHVYEKYFHILFYYIEMLGTFKIKFFLLL